MLLCPGNCRLSSQERLLQQQLERLTAVAGSEQRVQQQYEDSISSYLQDRGSRSRGLQAKAAKVRHACLDNRSAHAWACTEHVHHSIACSVVVVEVVNHALCMHVLLFLIRCMVCSTAGKGMSHSSTQVGNPALACFRRTVCYCIPMLTSRNPCSSALLCVACFQARAPAAAGGAPVHGPAARAP
jgi:hypothetical protein